MWAIIVWVWTIQTKDEAGGARDPCNANEAVPTMTWAGLQKRVEHQFMGESVRRTMELELDRLAQIDGQGFDPDEAAVIIGILGDPTHGAQSAPFGALRPYGDLFLTACLYVAVSDGRYTLEQSRHIGILAARLGWSAQQLAALERRVLRRLEARGRRLMAAG